MRLRLLATAAASLAAVVASTLPASAEDDTLDYVALGDSYSAASAVLPLDLSSPLCARSLVNYGHLVAAATGAAYTDVTCGAAQTSHLTSAQYPGVGPQLDAVTADTDLVTLTIGGNDNNTFIGAILACGSAGLLSAGIGSPCKNIYGDTFVDAIRTKTYPAVRDALTKIRAKAPDAEVAILGYPWILPATRGCYTKLPIASGDVPYLRTLQATLNGVIEQAARQTGATYVDFAQASEGHDACQAAGVRWIDPLFPTTSPVHPNALGQRQMAARTLAVLGLG